MDQVVDVLTSWGIDTVFGMVGHSNLGLAEALRRAEEAGRLRFVGIRHEGAAAFAASGYAKLTGRPAACFYDRRPGRHQPAHGPLGREGRPRADPRAHRPGADAGARAGCVPGAPLAPRSRRERVEPDRPLARERDRAGGARGEARGREPRRRPPHLPRRGAGAARASPIRPSGPAPAASPPPRSRRRRRAQRRAIELLRGAERPVIIAATAPAAPATESSRWPSDRRAGHHDVQGEGPRPRRPPARRAACSGGPDARRLGGMARSDCLLVLGASFSNHTGIATCVPTIQVDLDRMTLGKFHPVDVPLWGDIGRTLALLGRALPRGRPPRSGRRSPQRRASGDAEKARRAASSTATGAPSRRSSSPALARSCPTTP